MAEDKISKESEESASKDDEEIEVDVDEIFDDGLDSMTE